MRAIHDCYISQWRKVSNALRKIGKVKTLNVVYAMEDDYKDVKPSHDLQSKSYTKRSVLKRRYKILQSIFKLGVTAILPQCSILERKSSLSARRV